MTSLRKLEHDRTRADLASVEALLDQLSDEDVMMRLGLESRREELIAEIQGLDDQEETTASAALFFGGRPVAGNRGIESEFGGSAVTKFQDLVAKLLAREIGGLGQRGVVPNKDAATLHITNVVRGSFGFLLEEIEPQHQLVKTALKSAVDDASQLLRAFAEPNDEKFQEAVEAVDDRIVTTAREFFGLMRQSGATLRLVSGESDNSFGADAVARAAERADTTAVEDAEQTMEGQLGGFLPDAHQFEFRTAGPSGTIHGKVDRTLSASELADFNRRFVNVPAKIQLRVKRVRRNGHIVRESFTLLKLEPADDSSATGVPHNDAAP
jgi:hypothetical protein